MGLPVDPRKLEQGKRYIFNVRTADGQGIDTYEGLAFLGYGRWVVPATVHDPLEFVVVVADETAMTAKSGTHHVWSVDRIDSVQRVDE